MAEILAGIATAERVTAFLDRYTERDAAIERLVDDITVETLALVGELRERLQPHTRTALRGV